MYRVWVSSVNMAHYQYVQYSGLQSKYGSLPVCTVFSSPMVNMANYQYAQCSVIPGQIWLITSMHSVQFSQGKYGSLPACTVFSSPMVNIAHYHYVQCSVLPW